MDSLNYDLAFMDIDFLYTLNVRFYMEVQPALDAMWAAQAAAANTTTATTETQESILIESNQSFLLTSQDKLPPNTFETLPEVGDELITRRNKSITKKKTTRYDDVFY